MAKKKITTEKMTEKEIVTAIGEKREKLRSIRFALAGSRPKNVKEEQILRRDIARLLTMRTALLSK